MKSVTAGRYQWRTQGGDYDRLELIDTGTNRPIASITGGGRYYQWTRQTTMLFHSAPPASGEASTLLKAKIAVLSGLPD
jgi:hypothetical protein